MNEVYAIVEQFKGSHYDFGLFQAENIRNSDYLSKMAPMMKKYRNSDDAFKNAVNIISRFLPELIDELRGLSEGLNMPFEEIVFRFSGYFQEVKSGCSIVMNDGFMTRNYDQHPKSYDGRLILYKPEHRYATIGSSMLVTGRTDGMNEHGLVVGYNFVSVKGRTDGLTCNIITRILLETCQNIEEAITLLKLIPHRTAFNYCLLDKSGSYCVVEASAEGVFVRQDNICTNHFFIQDHLNPLLSSNSKNRYELMKSTYEAKQTLEAIYPLMNDRTYGIYSSRFDLDDGTLHTSAFQPDKLIMYISYGRDRYPVAIDFKSWIQGERILIRKIKGEGFPGYTFLYSKK